MKIKSISCTQFAGVSIPGVSFTDGVNIIYGKNESGKSTLVNLISRTLFQKAKLDRRSDKEFFELYFPTAKRGSSIVGDFADGELTIETDNGTYKLSKVWGVDASCRLSTPDGVIRDQNSIDQILKEVLVYGEGVYSDMLFSSQRNTDLSLQTIMDASKKTGAKNEIVDAVSMAFAESDGVSVDSIERAINEKIEEIGGKHWDIERNTPIKNSRNDRWSTGRGKILDAFYAFEDARKKLDDISYLEHEVERTSRVCVQMNADVQTAEGEYERFNTFASRLAVITERKRMIKDGGERIKEYESVLLRWPQLNQKLEEANKLQKEKANRNISDVWNFVQSVKAELSDEDYKNAELSYPESAEITNAKKRQREITSLENKLCGMNLNAAIEMLGDNRIQIVSMLTGENIDISEGVASITEAVRVIVPGVMEMQLSPANIDVELIKGQISGLCKEIALVLSKYGVQSIEELEAYAQRVDEAKRKIEKVNNRIERALGSVTIEQLEKLYNSAEPVDRTIEEIKSDIKNVCGTEDVDAFILKAKTLTDEYAKKYVSIEAVVTKKLELEAELKKAEESISDLDDIPVEYMGILDPEAHLERLLKDLKALRSKRDDVCGDKTAAVTKLEAYKSSHPEACFEDVEEKEAKYEEIKSLLNHWLHIKEAFVKQKESVHDNPMQDIVDRFANYLGVISDGKVASGFPKADKLDINIYSNNRLLDYGKLSEGTKETVSLAFRLAVLDHLFPDGGGVIVFDDPFTDMDAERTAQSCKLIGECATRHQVIFLTCKEEYLGMLNGNQIFI